MSYTDQDYEALEQAYIKATTIAYGRPDEFQYRQNQLLHQLIAFILKPYKEAKIEKKLKTAIQNHKTDSDERIKSKSIKVDYSRIGNAICNAPDQNKEWEEKNG